MEPYQWFFSNLIENNLLGSLAAVATILTVFVSAYRHFKDKNNEKTRSSRNLYLELRDTLTSLDYDKFPDDFCHIEITENKNKRIVYFMNRSLNHDFYDSLIFSGKNNFLEPNLQQLIQDIFKRIKMHNQFIEITRHMKEEQSDYSVPKKAYYYEWMDENEVRLKKEIPEMLSRLEQHFKIGLLKQA